MGISEAEAEEIARGAVEQYLDVTDTEATADGVYSQASKLGYDALITAGYHADFASTIAKRVAQCLVQQ